MTDTPLPILGIPLEAAMQIYAKRRALLTALVVPTVAIVLFDSMQESFGDTFLRRAVLFGAGAPFSVLYAIACHRVILLGEDSLNNRWSAYWTFRETRFLGWIVLIGIMASLLSFLLVIFTMPISGYWPRMILVGLVVGYLEVRFSLVLPATAIDFRTSLSDSWYLSSGNGLRLLVILLIPILPFAGLAFVVTSLPDVIPGFASTLVIVALGFVLTAVEIGVLSVSYRELSSFDRNVDTA